MVEYRGSFFLSLKNPPNTTKKEKAKRLNGANYEMSRLRMHRKQSDRLPSGYGGEQYSPSQRMPFLPKAFYHL